MINQHFSTVYTHILTQLAAINPTAYARSRNYLSGAVTYLSPYISRGVISTLQVRNHLAQRGIAVFQMDKLLQELAWREYWQRAWQTLGNAIFTDIKQAQTGVAHTQLPTALTTANTGIEAIDEGINNLYNTGYLHNHLRMYVASLACNIGQAHWLAPARWMYYHLLDGDPASNHLSWQWVAGTNSSKKYYCNQSNINQYTGSTQTGSYLDTSYEQLPHLPLPTLLQATTNATWQTSLPHTPPPILNPALPLLVYNSFNIDPLWHQQAAANRVLLLEPTHFEQYPVSQRVLSFIIALGNNIPGLQVYVGNVAQLAQHYQGTKWIYKEHPTANHYPGIAEARDWLFPEVQGYYPSFFAFWKKCQRYL